MIQGLICQGFEIILAWVNLKVIKVRYSKLKLKKMDTECLMRSLISTYRIKL